MHHVHRIAFIDEIISPPGPSIWRLYKCVCSLAASPGYEHNWIRMADVRRYPHFDIHRAVHGFVAGLPHVMATHVEMALASDLRGRKRRNRCAGGRACGPRLQSEPGAD